MKVTRLVENCILVAGLTMGTSLPVLAYVGPGMGAGAVAILLGLVISLLLIIVSAFYYPLKKFTNLVKSKTMGESDCAQKKEDE